jgi:hypothetical protein
MGVGTQQPDFAEFYRSAADECLRTVMVAAGNQDTAQELVDEAFARAWASWRTVSRHPAPKAWVVRTALNLGISRWRRRRREISVPDPARAAANWAPSPSSTAAAASPSTRRLCRPAQACSSSTAPDGSGGITIDPSALPPGAGVFIFDRPGAGFPGNPTPAKAPSGTTPLEHPRAANPLRPMSATGGPLAVGLVYASQQCTG